MVSAVAPLFVHLMKAKKKTATRKIMHRCLAARNNLWSTVGYLACFFRRNSQFDP
jgi:hypothetical protein